MSEGKFHLYAMEKENGRYARRWELNLTREIVENQIMKPFHSNQKFMCKGRIFHPERVVSIEVYKTNSPLKINDDESEYDVGLKVRAEGTEVTRDFNYNLEQANVRSITLNFNEIFIVHGHDDVSKLELARILENDLKLKAIILHEQPNQGRTVIEKFERYAMGPGYAIVILSPDDIGGENKSSEREAQLKPRARQNVILELGYFIGKLGRERVCVLHKGNVELPSDISGILFIPFNESVREAYSDLVREIKHAGYKL